MAIAAHDKFRVIHKGVEYEFEAAEEGGYIARVPAYPSAISEGETFEEALENICDGLVEALTTARKLGLDVPSALEHVLARV
jgi:predicted RNase H-like HicB family nuclease